MKSKSIQFNTLVQFAGKGIFAFFAFFLVAFLARSLGAKGFGTCTSLFAWISTLIVVADMGLYMTGVRKLSMVLPHSLPASLSVKNDPVRKLSMPPYNSINRKKIDKQNFDKQNFDKQNFDKQSFDKQSSDKRDILPGNPSHDFLDLIGNLMTARLIIAFVVICMACGVLWIIPYNPDIKILITFSLPCVILLSAARTFKSWFQANLIMHFSVAGEIAGCIVMVLVTVSMIHFNIGLSAVLPNSKEFAVVAGLAAGSGVLLLLYCFFAGLAHNLTICFNIIKIKKLIMEAMPLGISAILAILYFRFDMLMLSWMKPAQDVGIYGVAYTVVEVAAVAPALFLGSMLPVFTRAITKTGKKTENKIENQDHTLNQYYQKSFKLLALLAVIGLIIGLVFAEPLMVLIAGARFFQTTEPVIGASSASCPFFVFQILVVVAFLMVWGQLNGHMLVAGGKQKKILKLYFFLVPFNILLNFLLIPSYSYNGAAFATLISEAAALVITTSIVKKEYGVRPALLSLICR